MSLVRHDSAEKSIVSFICEITVCWHFTAAVRKWVHRIYAAELFISRFDKVTLHFAAGCSVRSRTVACGCSECNCCAAGDGPSPAAAMAAGVPTQPEPGTPLPDRAGV